MLRGGGLGTLNTVGTALGNSRFLLLGLSLSAGHINILASKWLSHILLHMFSLEVQVSRILDPLLKPGILK